MTASSSCRLWTPAQDAALRRGWAAGRPVEEIAAGIGRSVPGAIHRAKLLGLARPEGRTTWTTAEDAKLKELHSQGLTRAEIAAKVGRSPLAVKMRLCRVNQPRDRVERNTPSDRNCKLARERKPNVLDRLTGKSFHHGPDYVPIYPGITDTVAFAVGMAAGERRERESANPYRPGTAAAESWLDAWIWVGSKEWSFEFERHHEKPTRVIRKTAFHRTRTGEAKVAV